VAEGVIVNSSRTRWLLALGCTVAIVIPAVIWWRPNADDPVTIRFAGTTNHNDRTFLLFTITNHYATNIRGLAFQLIETTNGWKEADPPLRYVTAPGRRDLWLSAAGAANDGTVIGVVPPSSGTWVVAFEQLRYSQRKAPLRNRIVIYLYQHRYVRLAGWLRPSADRSWAPADNPGLALGPEMRGTKLK
jgi:hypothetical protein